ncbi:MAG: DegV family protein [Chloroflexi bacterium]|nr:DegV family protein [Chloroflexota bacterium]
MPNLHVVTDSFAHFPSLQVSNRPGITIVPNRIGIAGKMYREGVDLEAEEALKLLAAKPEAPTLAVPAVTDYAAVYEQLAQDHDGIISLHASRAMFASWHHAQRAAQYPLGGCKVIVLDTQTFSAGQALLVRMAANVVEQGETLDDIVRILRGAVARVYSIYYTETLDFLHHNHIMTPSHALLGAMIGIKPVLSIEDGQLITIEKVRTRLQATERLVEFAAEFTDVEDAIILQHKTYLTEQGRMLQDRLAVEFPDLHFPHALYGPSLAALIGPEATGLVVLERETDKEDDDFE